MSLLSQSMLTLYQEKPKTKFQYSPQVEISCHIWEFIAYASLRSTVILYQSFNLNLNWFAKSQWMFIVSNEAVFDSKEFFSIDFDKPQPKPEPKPSQVKQKLGLRFSI